MNNEEINAIFEFKTADRQKDDFFLNVFPTLDSFTKAKVLRCSTKEIKTFNFYLSRSKVKNQILEELQKEIDIFLNEDNIQNCLLLLPNILFYTNININDIDVDILLKPLKKILYITRNVYLLDNEDINQILTNMTKIIAYASSNKEEYDKLKNNKNYEYYEQIIYDFIDKIENSKMLDNNLINMIIEAFPAISFPKLKDKLSSKYSEEIDLSKYDSYISKMIPLEEDFEQFLKDIKKYRIKYGIIPKKICLYVNRFYNTYDYLIRLCNIDLMRHYLMNAGTKDVCVFCDDSMVMAEGLAADKLLVMKNPDLSVVLFHEARHVIQFNNMNNNLNYKKYNYNLLKDTILHKYMDEKVYDRNHNRYYFEIDADIAGAKEYYRILEQMNLITEDDKEKMNKLDENEQIRVAMSSHLNIDGYDYEKGILFDDILEKNPNLLFEYPILQIEYDSFGLRKSMLDILKSLEDEINQNKRSKDEIIGIANCIFGEYYEVKDLTETLNSLKKSNFQNSVILEIEKKLISELQDLISNVSKLEVESNIDGIKK